MKTKISFLTVLVGLICLISFAFKKEAKFYPDGEDRDVTLVVSGQGKTIDEARQNALRSAIEQAFGTFISSNTTILNDSLVRDEIVSVSSGNIKKYETISEVQIPDGGFASTLRATVSVSKLTSFCESKGVTVEFKGGLFAMNIKMQQLNEVNEVKSIRNVNKVLKSLTDKCFDYSIKTLDPLSANMGPDLWIMNFYVGVKVNNNFSLLKKYLIESIRDISMSDEDVQKYQSMNLPVYPVEVSDGGVSVIYHFRKEQSLAYLQDFVWYFSFGEGDFFVNDGIADFSIYDYSRISLAGTYGGALTNSNDLQHLEFKYGLLYTSTWNIYNENPHDVPLYPPWGTFKNRSSARSGTTYQMTKDNLRRERNSLIDELKRDSLKLEKDRKEYAKTSNSAYWYSAVRLEEYIKGYKVRLSFWADSNTVFCRGNGDYGYPHGWFSQGSSKVGATRGHDNQPEVIQIVYLKLNLSPPVTEYATVAIAKYYTTDELSKVSAFTVRSSK